MDRFDALQQELSRRCPALEVRRDEPMAKHTTFRIGGPARLFLAPRTAAELAAALEGCRGVGVRPLFLGNGSNLLAPDKGYGGVVLSMGELARLSFEEGRVYASGGALLPKISAAALEHGLTGLEFAGGIPGSAGGAAVMNAGAYGGEMAQAVEFVDVLDLEGRSRRVPAAGCAFAYRRSAFSGGELLVAGVCFRLTPGDREEIRAKMADLAQRRKEKQPLEYPSAGSTFKRPAPLADGTPVYAAALIDRCGLKGLSVGGAQVSEKHAGFIINRGGATFDDVVELMEKVRETVLKRTGVELEPEVKILK